MPVEILLNSTNAAGYTAFRNTKNFSVQEDATPIEPSSSFGGVGSISFAINADDDAAILSGPITVMDSAYGKTGGTINNVSSTDGDVSITADSALGLFNTQRVAQPYTGTLDGAIQYYCDLVGITNNVVVDDIVAARSVVYPGWNGNVWVFIKQLLVAEQIEMALVFDRIYVRPLRALTATMDRATSINWSVDNSGAAHAIEIYYYNNVYGTQQEIYPLATEEPTIYSVGANETIKVTAQLNASVAYINQPNVVDFVNDESYAGTSGVYAVTGSDNLPITAAQWTAQGGSLSVVVTDDPSVIEITIIGASMPDYAPYRISMSSGAGNDYNSLHITATAVSWDKKLVTLPTGATNVTTSDAVGATIDNPFISSLAQAYSLGVKAAQAYAGINYSISGNAQGVNRSGDGDELISPTIANFNNSVLTGTTITDFNVAWSASTIAEFNDFWQAQVDILFANQLFGNTIGSRVLRSDANFRVTSSTISETGVAFTAAMDTLVSDFSAARVGDTIADFNAQFVGYTNREFSIMPLRRD